MKIKRMKLFATIAIASFVFFGIFSCSEDENNGEEVNVITKSSATPENKDNPYDYIGKIHNEELGKIMNEVLANNLANNKTTAQVYQIVGGILVKDGFASSLSELSSIFPLTTFECLLADTSNLYRSALNNMNLSSTVKDYMIDSLFVSLLNQSNISDDYRDLKTTIVSLESNILSSQNINASDKTILLKVMSTARYSLYYWLNFANNLSVKSKVPFSKIFVFLSFDAIGAAVGGHVGAMIASGVAGVVLEMSEDIEQQKPENPDTTNTKVN